jgi:hypothetical protein
MTSAASAGVIADDAKREVRVGLHEFGHALDVVIF